MVHRPGTELVGNQCYLVLFLEVVNIFISSENDINNSWFIRISIISYYCFSISTNGNSNDDVLLPFMGN